MFCTVCAAFNSDRTPVCGECGASLRTPPAAGRGRRQTRARTVASLAPLAAVLLALLLFAGRGWQADRQRADQYRTAEIALGNGRLLSARAGFAALDGYRDAGDRAAELDAVVAPSEERTRSASEALAAGNARGAIVALRPIVAELPDLDEAVALLEQARRYLVDETVAASDHSVAAGDIVGARETLTAGLALEPTSEELSGRLRELDSTHPLLLMTNAGDVAVAGFDGGDQRLLSTGKDATWAVWSPDRSRVAFMAAPETSDDWRSKLWVVDADGGGERVLADNAFRSGAPSWSPDGRTIIFVSGDDFDWTLGKGWVGLRAVDAATGKQRDLTGDRFDFTTSVAWSPDGRQIAFVERHIYQPENARQLAVRGGDVFVLDLATLETRNLTRGVVEDLFWVSWSPRGDQMTAITHGDDWASADPNRLVRIDVASGAVEELATGAIVTGSPCWSPDGSMVAVVQDNRVVRIWSDDGEVWVRLPTNVDTVISWSPDGSALVVPPMNLQDPTRVVHVGSELGRIDTIRVMFDNSSSGGGPPQWSPRTQPLPEEALPSGTALD